MTPRDFSIGNAIGFGWNTALRKLGFFIVTLLVIAVLTSIPGVLSNWLGRDDDGIAVLFSLVQTVIGIIVTMGLINICLHFVDGQNARLGDLFEPAPQFLNFLVANVLAGLAVMIGLILLILPGIYLAVKLQFFGYPIVDRGVGPIDALKESFAITNGVFWKVLLFDVLATLIVIAGAIAFGVGLFVAIPLVEVATAFIYRRLAPHPTGAAWEEPVATGR